MKEYFLCTVLVLAVLAGNVVGMANSDGDKKETESSLKKTESKSETKPEGRTCSAEEMKKCAAGTKPEGKTCSAEEMKKCAAGAKPEGKTCSEEEMKKCATDAAKAKEVSAVVEGKPAQDKVFVTVNGVEIMQSKIDKQVDKMIGSRAASMPPEQLVQMKPMAQQRVANMMVDKQLFHEKIKAKKIEISKEQVAMKIEEIAGQRNKTSADFLKELAANGIDASDVKEEIGIMLGVEKLVDTEVAAEIAVTDEDAKKFYDGNAQRYSKGEQVKASHILAGGRGIDDEARVKAKVKIEEAMTKLKAGGNFEELAREYSDCPSKANGGDLKVYFDKSGRIDGSGGGMDAKFTEATFALKVGQTSEITETPFGYHIIKLTDRKEAKTTSFEEVKADIVGELEGRKKSEFGRKYLEQLKAEAKIIWSKEAEKIMKAAPSMGRPPRRPARPPVPAPKPKPKQPVKVEPKPVEPVKN